MFTHRHYSCSCPRLQEKISQNENFMNSAEFRKSRTLNFMKHLCYTLCTYTNYSLCNTVVLCTTHTSVSCCVDAQCHVSSYSVMKSASSSFYTNKFVVYTSIRQSDIMLMLGVISCTWNVFMKKQPIKTYSDTTNSTCDYIITPRHWGIHLHSLWTCMVKLCKQT